MARESDEVVAAIKKEVPACYSGVIYFDNDAAPLATAGEGVFSTNRECHFPV